MAARKASMVPSEGRRKSIYDRKPSVDSRKGDRKSSLDRKSTLEVPYVGRRGSVASERRMSMAESVGRSGQTLSADGRHRGINIRYENTYKVEPDKRFPIYIAKKIAAEILETNLKDKPYNRDDCARQARTLSDQIKQKVKALDFPRYKIVTIVAIGQQQDSHPSLSFTSRCVWNDRYDSFAEATFKSNVMYAVALVYALYSD